MYLKKMKFISFLRIILEYILSYKYNIFNIQKRESVLELLLKIIEFCVDQCFFIYNIMLFL